MPARHCWYFVVLALLAAACMADIPDGTISCTAGADRSCPGGYVCQQRIAGVWRCFDDPISISEEAGSPATGTDADAANLDSGVSTDAGHPGSAADGAPMDSQTDYPVDSEGGVGVGPGDATIDAADAARPSDAAVAAETGGPSQEVSATSTEASVPSSVCGNGVVEPGETCDPLVACAQAAQLCVSDTSTLRSAIGDVSACTFLCSAVPRSCGVADGQCPQGCTRTTDADCKLESGATCVADAACESGSCAQGVCCDRRCDAPCEACNRLGRVGVCTLPDYATDVLNCGACGVPCSANHVAPMCQAGMCATGQCAGTWLDCNKDKKTDGCEVDTSTDARHCGGCDSAPCAYGMCTGGVCRSTRWGFPGATAPTTVNLARATLWSLPIATDRAASLVALGIVVQVDAQNASVQARLALYSDSGGVPNRLIAQTDPFSTVLGVNEQKLSAAVEIPAGSYWLAFVSEGTLRVLAESTSVSWWSATSAFAPAPTSFPLAKTMSAGRAHVFAVTAP